MSIEAIGSIGEILGALAVLVSLIYLAKQIKHSTDVSKVTTYHDGIGQILQSGLNPEFARLTVKMEGGESLDPFERNYSTNLATAFIFGHEILYCLYNKGQVDEDLWNNIIVNNLPYLRSDMVLPVAKQRIGSLSEDFVRLIEAS